MKKNNEFIEKTIQEGHTACLHLSTKKLRLHNDYDALKEICDTCGAYRIIKHGKKYNWVEKVKSIDEDFL